MNPGARKRIVHVRATTDPEATVANEPIDLDKHATWPEASRRWSEGHADRLAGSTEFLPDLAISLEQEDEFRQTFGSRKVLAYHATRLLPHEAGAIRTHGLRLLDEQLVRDRIADAITHGVLPDATRHHAETGNVYVIRNEEGRGGRICFIIGRAAFDEDPGGYEAFLRHWGGEAIRGGPGEVAELATIGTPSIVVAKLNLTRRHNDPYSFPELAKLFVGSLLGLDGRFAEVHYPRSVSGRDLLAIWQPAIASTTATPSCRGKGRAGQTAFPGGPERSAPRIALALNIEGRSGRCGLLRAVVLIASSCRIRGTSRRQGASSISTEDPAVRRGACGTRPPRLRDDRRSTFRLDPVERAA